MSDDPPANEGGADGGEGGAGDGRDGAGDDSRYGAGADIGDDAGADGDEDAADGERDAGDAPAAAAEQVPYVESPIIMATVRVVAPFVFTFGLFVMFHGADSSGGGFQGGVIVGTVVLMLGIAFGIENTSAWVDPAVPVVLVGAGVAAFLGIGIGTVAVGGAFLDYPAVGIHHASEYGIELVELAIGLIVSGIVTGLFFAIAAGEFGGEPP